MSKNIRFSIVIPVFNVAIYLRACIDSLLAQTQSDFELLIVDDGSSDDSWDIIVQYAVVDQRIRTFRKENAGVSAARNYGMDRAQGEYICFVDGDDIVSPRYLEDLYQAMQQGADCSMCGFQTFSATQPMIHVIVPSSRGIETREENLRAFYDFHKPIWQRNLWNRMYKLSVIQEKHIRFREDIHIKEDGLFVVEYLLASNGLVGLSNQILYFYRSNPAGAMGVLQKGFNPKLMTDLLAHEALIKALTDNNLPADIIALAKEQAISVGNWILTTLLSARSKNISFYWQLEKRMSHMLGLKDYLSWRFSQLKKKLI